MAPILFAATISLRSRSTVARQNLRGSEPRGCMPGLNRILGATGVFSEFRFSARAAYYCP
jgi:hypothetical protein